MTSIMFLVIELLLFAILPSSQGQALIPDIHTWYINAVSFSALVTASGTQIGGKIRLYRAGSPFLSSYIVYNAVDCTHSQNLTETPLKDGWMSCQEYVDAPQGETDLSPDVYERLKWRFVDFEYTNRTSKLEGVTVQVVNAIPANV
jgi:hypothetical protein